MDAQTSNKHLNRAKGFKSESLVIKYLVGNGYAILDTNWSCKLGEIDIVAYKDGVTIIVEVKSRNSANYGSGLEAINYTKQKKISKTAFAYLSSKNKTDTNIRFDAIQVDKYDNIVHIENAFYSTVRY